MNNANSPCRADVDKLLLNAELRDQLEPYFDESVDFLQWKTLPTESENDFLASMLAWERAPALRIAEWFQPSLELPAPDSLNDKQLSEQLWQVIHQFHQQRIVLEMTDHLSDRQLYCVIYRDILPSYEKKVDLPKNYLHWHCVDHTEDETTWLRYYATDEERDEWQKTNNAEPPASETPPYPRKMPSRPR